MNKILPREIVRRITKSHFTRIRPDGLPRKVSTKWLGHLVLESLCEYRAAQVEGHPERFGQQPRSLDAVVKHLVDTEVGNNPRSPRVKNLNRLLDAYDRPRGPREALARKKVGRVRADKFFQRKAQQVFANATSDMIAQRVGRERIIPPGIALSEQPATDKPLNYRNIRVDLDSIYCIEEQEVSDDELYYMTGAVLTDPAGTYDRASNEIRETVDDVDDGDDVEIPDYMRPICVWDVLKPEDTSTATASTLLCTVTLMEHDQSDRSQVYQAFHAAYSTGKLLVALLEGTAGGPVGIAVSIVGIFILVLLALDGDDELGTAVFRYDNVLGPDEMGTLGSEFEINGKRKGEKYRYLIKTQYTAVDYWAPIDLSCKISGPRDLFIRRAGELTKGTYKVEAKSLGLAVVPIEDIRWSVSPAGTQIAQQGQQKTRIEFFHPDTYTVRVTAKVQGHAFTVTDNHTVFVNMVPDPGIPT